MRERRHSALLGYVVARDVQSFITLILLVFFTMSGCNTRHAALKSGDGMTPDFGRTPSWQDLLEQGPPRLTIPKEPVHIDRELMLSATTEVIGPGTVIIDPTGGLTIASGVLTLRNVMLQLKGRKSGIRVRGSLMVDNSVIRYVDADPTRNTEPLIDVRGAKSLTTISTSTLHGGQGSMPLLLIGSDARLVVMKSILEAGGTAVSAQQAKSVIVHRTQFLNNATAMALDQVKEVTIKSNRIERYTAVVGLRISKTSKLSFAGNTLLNGNGNGLTILDAGLVTMQRNFFHSLNGTSVSLMRVSQATLSYNVVAYSRGAALDVETCGQLHLAYNVLHQNQVVSNYTQHKLANVQQLTEQGNLQDSDFTSGDLGRAFGTNRKAYSFKLGADNTPRRMIATDEALDLAAWSPLPVKDDAKLTSWIVSLSKGDVVSLPQGGVLVDRKITLTRGVSIKGAQDRTLAIVGDGAIVFAPNNGQAQLQLTGVKVYWKRDLDREGATTAFLIKGGVPRIRDCTFHTANRPPQAGKEALSGKPAVSWLFRFEAGDAIVDGLEIKGNSFDSAYWYGGGVLMARDVKGLPRARIQNNSVWGHHGGFYLDRADDGLVTDNRMTHVSYGNIVLRKSKRLDVARNSLIYPGNGTGGDGLTLTNLEDSLVEHNTIINGACYGMWLHTPMKNVTISQNVVFGGITTGLMLAEPSQVPPTGTYHFSNIAIRDNLFSHNRGWGLIAISGDQFQIENNIFQANADDRFGNQHYFLDQGETTAKSNLLAQDPGTEPRLTNYTMASYGDSLQLQNSGGVTTLVTHARREGEWNPNGQQGVRLDNQHFRASHHSSVSILVDPKGLGRVFASDAKVAVVSHPGQLAMSSDSRQVRVLASSLFAKLKADDSAVVYDSSDDDNVIVDAKHVRMASKLYAVNIKGSQEITLHASDPGDKATLYDSADNDLFESTPSRVKVTYDSEVQRTLLGFATVTAIAKNGGFDRASFSDGPGNDTFIGHPQYARLMAFDGTTITAIGCDAILAEASSANDSAILYDSAGADRLICNKDSSVTLESPTVTFTLKDFSAVEAIARDSQNTVEDNGQCSWVLTATGAGTWGH